MPVSFGFGPSYVQNLKLKETQGIVTKQNGRKEERIGKGFPSQSPPRTPETICHAGCCVESEIAHARPKSKHRNATAKTNKKEKPRLKCR
jgi:hypothetical protein